jgi:2-dehydropantoate 2-reductase
MKFVIAGAGAIGAYLGACMARAGQDVTVFARGPHLRAMQERGIRVRSAEGDFEAHPKAAGSLDEIGPADVVFLGVKAHSLPALAPRLRPLLGPETAVVSMQNGIPWWYFQNHGGELDGLHLERVDPGGVIAGAIEARRVVGSLAYFSTAIAEPGVVEHVAGNRLTLGEPDGSRSERCRCIAETLIAAGLRCPITTHIRQEIWVKILGNVAFNPISALTGATLVQMARDPEVAALVRSIMSEAECVAARLGFTLPVTIEQRMAGAEKVGEHKTSMLQDLEAGRPLELEPIVGAVVEIGERLHLSMTNTKAVYACARLLAQRRAQQPPQAAPPAAGQGTTEAAPSRGPGGAAPVTPRDAAATAPASPAGKRMGGTAPVSGHRPTATSPAGPASAAMRRTSLVSAASPGDPAPVLGYGVGREARR